MFIAALFSSVVVCVFIQAVVVTGDQPVSSAGQCNTTNRIPYFVLEEIAPTTLIGNVAVDSGLKDRYDRAVLRDMTFQFSNRSSLLARSLVTIDRKTGIMKTAVKMDRDVLCEEQTAAGARCLFCLDIVVGPQRYRHVIEVAIEVLDINDHAPEFPVTEVHRSVAKTAPLGTVISVPAASDIDASPNNIQNYALLSNSDVFELVDDGGGFGEVAASTVKELRLVLQADLTEEDADFYQFTIVARDGGNPPKSASVLVNVVVQTTEQRLPRFANSTYVVYVNRYVAAGTTVAHVSAEKNEEDSYAVVIYDFTAATLRAYGHIFGIVETSGSIYLKQSLQFDEETAYRLEVTARNHNQNTNVAYSVLTIRVDNYDNNAASDVIIDTLTGDPTVALVSEASPVGTVVASISLRRHLQAKRTSQLACYLEAGDAPFTLAFASPLYQIITAEPVDREDVAEYVVDVSCTHIGAHAHFTNRTISIVIEDVNDNAPVFAKNVYFAVVHENSAAGHGPLTQVNATDLDKDNNGQVRYTMHPSHAGLLRVDEITGQVFTRQSFDREQTGDEITVKVIAYDLGSPKSLSSTALLTVTVIDENDEAPEFTAARYTFAVVENTPPGDSLGAVAAVDRDSKQFAHVTYTFSNSSLPVAEGRFSVDSQTGRLWALVALDREAASSYRLSVLAINDKAEPHMTATATVIVYVTDENDNSPTVRWPTSDNQTVSISRLTPGDRVVATVMADDADLDDNANLTFAVVSVSSISISGSSSLAVSDTDFVIDQTGRVKTAPSWTAAPGVSSYTVDISVSDRGRPARATVCTLTIELANATYAMMAESATLQQYVGNGGIIASLVAAFTCVLFVLIIAIFVVKSYLREHVTAYGSSASDCGGRMRRKKEARCRAEDRQLQDAADGCCREVVVGRLESSLSGDSLLHGEKTTYMSNRDRARNDLAYASLMSSYHSKPLNNTFVTFADGRNDELATAGQGCQPAPGRQLSVTSLKPLNNHGVVEMSDVLLGDRLKERFSLSQA